MHLHVVFLYLRKSSNLKGLGFQQVLAEMTDGGVDRSIECTGNIDAMISAFECVHDVFFSSLFHVYIFIEPPINNHKSLRM